MSLIKLSEAVRCGRADCQGFIYCNVAWWLKGNSILHHVYWSLKKSKLITVITPERRPGAKGFVIFVYLRRHWSERLRPTSSTCLSDFLKQKRFKSSLPLPMILDHYLHQRWLQGPAWTPGDSPPPPAAAPDSPTQPYLWDGEKHEGGCKR